MLTLDFILSIFVKTASLAHLGVLVGDKVMNILMIIIFFHDGVLSGNCVWRYMYRLTTIQWCQHAACHQPHDLHPICKSMDSPLRDPPLTANTTHLWVKLILVTVVTLDGLQFVNAAFCFV